MKKSFTLFILLLLVSLILTPLLRAGTAKTNTTDSVQLEWLQTYPAEEEEDVYFKFPPFIAVDKAGYLYAFDPNSHQFFYKIDREGKLVKQIGRHGKGPGDVFNPRGIKIEGDTVYLQDWVGISSFTLDGKFLQRFRQFRVSSSFDVHGGKVYIQETGKDHLIAVYDASGNKLATFGEPLTLPTSVHFNHRLAFETLNEGKILCGEKSLFYYFAVLGEIHRFDYAGKLISRKKLQCVDRESFENNRKKFYHKGFSQKENIGFATVVNDITYHDGKFYLITGNSDKYRKDIVCISSDTLEVAGRYSFDVIRDSIKRPIYPSELEISAEGDEIFAFVVVNDLEDHELYIHKYKIPGGKPK